MHCERCRGLGEVWDGPSTFGKTCRECEGFHPELEIKLIRPPIVGYAGRRPLVVFGESYQIVGVGGPGMHRGASKLAERIGIACDHTKKDDAARALCRWADVVDVDALHDPMSLSHVFRERTVVFVGAETARMFGVDVSDADALTCPQVFPQQQDAEWAPELRRKPWRTALVLPSVRKSWKIKTKRMAAQACRLLFVGCNRRKDGGFVLDCNDPKPDPTITPSALSTRLAHTRRYGLVTSAQFAVWVHKQVNEHHKLTALCSVLEDAVVTPQMELNAAERTLVRESLMESIGVPVDATGMPIEVYRHLNKQPLLEPNSDETLWLQAFERCAC